MDQRSDLFEGARERFGRDIAACYDARLDFVRRILGGERHPKATPSRREIEEWAASLDEKDRRAVLLLCEKVVFGTLSCLLNKLDGTSLDTSLSPDERYRLSLAVSQQEATPPMQTDLADVELNPDGYSQPLHESLPGWLTSFSRFGPPKL